MKSGVAAIQMRKLAAIDIVFLGPKFVIAEYALGVLLSIALGIFILARAHSIWPGVLGVYFLCLGLNYAPMLTHAIAIRTKHQATVEMRKELEETRRAMAKYRRVSLLLLIPFWVPFLEFMQKRARPE